MRLRSYHTECASDRSKIYLLFNNGNLVSTISIDQIELGYARDSLNIGCHSELGNVLLAALRDSNKQTLSAARTSSEVMKNNQHIVFRVMENQIVHNGSDEGVMFGGDGKVPRDETDCSPQRGGADAPGAPCKFRR